MFQNLKLYHYEKLLFNGDLTLFADSEPHFGLGTAHLEVSRPFATEENLSCGLDIQAAWEAQQTTSSPAEKKRIQRKTVQDVSPARNLFFTKQALAIPDDLAEKLHTQ